jgi:hypothetical protein
MGEWQAMKILSSISFGLSFWSLEVYESALIHSHVSMYVPLSISAALFFSLGIGLRK